MCDATRSALAVELAPLPLVERRDNQADNTVTISREEFELLSAQDTAYANALDALIDAGIRDNKGGVVAAVKQLSAQRDTLAEALRALLRDAEDAAAFNRKQGYTDIAAERMGRVNVARAALATLEAQS